MTRIDSSRVTESGKVRSVFWAGTRRPGPRAAARDRQTAGSICDQQLARGQQIVAPDV